MKESEIKILSKPKLTHPTFILGLNDQYDLNGLIAQTLIEHTQSKKFAELYSPYFPDCIVSEETGILHLPRYDFFSSESFDPNTVIMTGNVLHDPDNSEANYEVFSSVLDFAKSLKCRRFISFGTFQADSSESKIHVAATSKSLVSQMTRKLGAVPFASGRIDGVVGTIIGLAKIHRIPAICLLGLLSQHLSLRDMAEKIFTTTIEALKVKAR